MSFRAPPARTVIAERAEGGVGLTVMNDLLEFRLKTDSW